MAGSDEDSDDQSTKSGSVSGDRVYKCCSKVCKSLICVNCLGLYHKSCARRASNIKFNEDSTITCCPNLTNINNPNNSTNEAELERLKLENQYLKQLLLEKDEINQLLRDKNELLEYKIRTVEDADNKLAKGKGSTYGEVARKIQKEGNKAVTKLPNHENLKRQVTEVQAVQRTEAEKHSSLQTNNGVIKGTTEGSSESGWVQQRRHRKQKTKTLGSGEHVADTKFEGKKPKVWMYIYRVQQSATEEAIVEYLKRKTGKESGEFIVKDLEVKDTQHKCFMVAADFSFKELFYKAEFWPKGVGFKRFDFKLQQKYATRSFL